MNDYNFNKILFKYYKNKYKSIKNFELIHELLETNDISDKDKLFYLENKIPIFGINDREKNIVINNEAGVIDQKIFKHP